MKKIISNIDEKINVILALKSKIDINIKKRYIYVSVVVLMSLFFGIAYGIGFLLKLDYDVRYLIYIAPISVITTTLFVTVMMELKVQAENKITYNAFLGALDRIIYNSMIVFGLMILIMILVFPEIAKTIDIIIFTFLFLVALISYIFIRNFFAAYKETPSIITLLGMIIFLGLIFIATIVLSTISSPWLVMIIFIIYVGLLLLLKNILHDRLPKMSSKIGIVFVVAAILLTVDIFASHMFPMLGWDYGNNTYYTYDILLNEKAVGSIVLPAPNGLLINGNYYYYDSYDSVSGNTKFEIYNKSTDQTTNISFNEVNGLKEEQGHYYVQNEYNASTQLYELTEDKATLIGTYSNTYSTDIPILLNGTYYLFPRASFQTALPSGLQTHTFNEPRLLSDTDVLLDTSQFNNDILYQDTQTLVMKIPFYNTYFVFNSSNFYNSFGYSNNHIMYYDGDLEQYFIQTPEDYLNGVDNAIALPSEFSGSVISGFFSYKNNYYILTWKKLYQLNSEGHINSSVLIGHYQAQLIGSDLMLSQLFDPGQIKSLNLDVTPFTKTLFNKLAEDYYNSEQYYWLLTLAVFTSLGIIFVKPAGKVSQ